MIIWDILQLETSPGRSFLRDCSQLAFYIEPSPEAASSIVAGLEKGDALSVAFACVVLANAGLEPRATAMSSLVTKLSADVRAQAQSQLETISWWREDKASIMHVHIYKLVSKVCSNL